MKTKETGNLGEDIAERFLIDKGFKIIERNYKKKIGEIDIIGRKDGKLCIFEVKSFSHETPFHVSYETGLRPEENVDDWKKHKIRKITEYYVMDKKLSHETEIEFYVVSLIIDLESKIVKVKLIKDIL